MSAETWAAEFPNVLAAVLDPNNAARRAAEARLKEMEKAPDQLLQLLIGVSALPSVQCVGCASAGRAR